MKKIILLIILFFPILVLAQDDYKIISELDVEVEYFNYLKYKEYGNDFTLVTGNKFYKMDKINGDVRSVDIVPGELSWISYDSTNMTLGENNDKYILISQPYYTHEGDYTTIYLFDSKLNILNQQTINSKTCSSINIVKDKLMVYYYSYEEEYDMEVILYNKDLSYYKTDYLKGDVNDYDYTTNKFYSSHGWKDQLESLRYYYEFDENYDLVKKSYKTRVIRDSLSYLELYDFENNQVIKDVRLIDKPGSCPEMFDYYELNNKIYVLVRDEYEQKFYVNLYDNELNLIKSREYSYFFSDLGYSSSRIYDGYFIISDSFTCDSCQYSKNYYFDKDLNEVNIPIYSGSPIKINREYESNSMLQIGYDLFFEKGQLLYDIKVINNKYYFLAEDRNTSLVNLYIYNKDGTLYDTKKILDEGYGYEYASGSIVKIGDKISVNYSSVFKTKKITPANIHKVYDLDGNELEYDLSDIYENYSSLPLLERGDEIIYLLVDPKDYSVEDQFEFNIKVVKLLRKANINSNNGNVSLDTDELYKGKEVSIDIEPKPGYEVKNIIIKDQDGNIIEVKDNKFIYPDGDITIDVEYEKEIINPFTRDMIIIYSVLIIFSIIKGINLYKKRKEVI